MCKRTTCCKAVCCSVSCRRALRPGGPGVRRAAGTREVGTGGGGLVAHAEARPAHCLELQLIDVSMRDFFFFSFELKLGKTSPEKSNSGKGPSGESASLRHPSGPPYAHPWLLGGRRGDSLTPRDSVSKARAACPSSPAGTRLPAFPRGAPRSPAVRCSETSSRRPAGRARRLCPGDVGFAGRWGGTHLQQRHRRRHHRGAAFRGRPRRA